MKLAPHTNKESAMSKGAYTTRRAEFCRLMAAQGIASKTVDQLVSAADRWQLLTEIHRHCRDLSDQFQTERDHLRHFFGSLAVGPINDIYVHDDPRVGDTVKVLLQAMIDRSPIGVPTRSYDVERIRSVATIGPRSLAQVIMSHRRNTFRPRAQKQERISAYNDLNTTELTQEIGALTKARDAAQRQTLAAIERLTGIHRASHRETATDTQEETPMTTKQSKPTKPQRTVGAFLRTATCAQLQEELTYKLSSFSPDSDGRVAVEMRGGYTVDELRLALEELQKVQAACDAWIAAEYDGEH